MLEIQRVLSGEMGTDSGLLGCRAPAPGTEPCPRSIQDAFPGATGLKVPTQRLQTSNLTLLTSGEGSAPRPGAGQHPEAARPAPPPRAGEA